MHKLIKIKTDLPKYKVGEPWVEKYRPQTLDDVIGNESAVNQLKEIARNGDLPNMIITGTSGSGKTSSILCLAKHLLGSKFKENVLELNASDDRGIDVIRSKINVFSSKVSNLDKGKFKIVILDEADSMIDIAQRALRRQMDIHHKTTRYIFSCNIGSNIISSIQSRCSVLHYTVLNENQMVKKAVEICKKENIKFTNEGLEMLAFTANGDMRKMINNLQSVACAFGSMTKGNIMEICYIPYPDQLRRCLDLCFEDRLKDACVEVKMVCEKGFSPFDIIEIFLKIAKHYHINHPDVDEDERIMMFKAICNTHLRIISGLNGLIQITALMAKIHAIRFAT